MVIDRTQAFEIQYLVRATTKGNIKASIPVFLKICGGPVENGGEVVHQPDKWISKYSFDVLTIDNIIFEPLISINPSCPIIEISLENDTGSKI